MKGRISYPKDGGPPRFFIDNKPVTKEEFDKAFPPAKDHGPTAQGLIRWKEIHSEALAVHPLDIAEAEADARAKGVPTSFDADGRPVLTSRRHRKEYLKAYGFHDRSGGYGD